MTHSLMNEALSLSTDRLGLCGHMALHACTLGCLHAGWPRRAVDSVVISCIQGLTSFGCAAMHAW